MRPELLASPPRSRFTFIVGKGGVGKSTTASALALNWADSGYPIHLLSTDPAPSLSDIFGVSARGRVVAQCNDNLRVEELDAAAITNGWLARVRAPLEELVERGTYLDKGDIAKLHHLTLPGVDEVAAALRIAELSRSASTHIVVDTAPTGHTLRLLDSADTIDSWVAAFRAMAGKVSAVAFSMVGARVRMAGEDIVDELSETAAAFREALRRSSFVLITRPDAVVDAETKRLAHALQSRKLRVIARVCVAADTADNECAAGDDGPEMLHVARVPDARGCNGLRSWARAARVQSHPASAHSPSSRGAAPEAVAAGTRDGAVGDWITGQQARLLWCVGKGGVGKSTCAAAIALQLSRDRRVILCSTDPAGSLADVLPDADGLRLRVQQVDAAADLALWRERYRADAEAVMNTLGLGGTATLDRDIMGALWDVVPPGIDELFALSQVVDAAETTETIVVDAAPTGHFLRLIESPEIALEWTHALMRILLKYGVAGGLEDLSQRVLAFARQLKQLDSLLHDASGCGVFVVTLDQPVVRAQTARLLSSLGDAGMEVLALITNRTTSGTSHVSGAPICIGAPQRARPPVGQAALRDFLDEWYFA